VEPNLDPSPIRFGRAICGDLRQSERREWWLANGLGAYAAGTVAGTLTRRYHGLLIAPIDPPLGRRLVLAKADATLVIGNQTWPLFTNRWADGAIDPRDLCNIESFHLDGTVPVWRYVVAGTTIEQRIWLEYGANTVYVAYRLVSSFRLADDPPQLRIRLLANNRDHHGDTDVQGFTPHVAATGDTLAVEAKGTTLTIMAIGGNIAPRLEWHWNFDLPIESERGLGHRDHHLCVGEVRLPVQRDRATGIAASIGSLAGIDLDIALPRRRDHDAAVLRRAATRFREPCAVPGWVARCALTADAYVFSRPLPTIAEGESVIAGYPWFGEWGRDTMIALPGLTLAIGRHDGARRILQSFTAFLDRGLLPNTFPGPGVYADYNSVDATLWFIEAWRAYVESSADTDALAAAFPTLAEALRWYMAGTRYGIGVDHRDGLLRAGEPGIQVTWMDAKIGDWVVTPRIGKPVEVNALWYNALMAMAQFAKRLGKTSPNTPWPPRWRDKALSVLSGPTEGSSTSSMGPTETTRRSGRTRSSPRACRIARSTPPPGPPSWPNVAGTC
jgi:4-alpha-glucanotransferase